MKISSNEQKKRIFSNKLPNLTLSFYIQFIGIQMFTRTCLISCTTFALTYTFVHQKRSQVCPAYVQINELFLWWQKCRTLSDLFIGRGVIRGESGADQQATQFVRRWQRPFILAHFLITYTIRDKIQLGLT
jgi:hypothetical protein